MESVERGYLEIHIENSEMRVKKICRRNDKNGRRNMRNGR
jgi:hypothetical protein